MNSKNNVDQLLDEIKARLVQIFSRFDIDIDLKLIMDDTIESIAFDKSRAVVRLHSGLLNEKTADELYELVGVEYGKYLWFAVVEKENFIMLNCKYEEAYEYSMEQYFARDLFAFINRDSWTLELDEFLDEVSSTEHIRLT